MILRHTGVLGDQTAWLDVGRTSTGNEGCITPMSDGWRRELSQTAYYYLLSRTRARACPQDKSTGPGIKLAFLPKRASAMNTASRQYGARQPTNGTEDEGNRNLVRAARKPKRDQGPGNRPNN